MFDGILVELALRLQLRGSARRHVQHQNPRVLLLHLASVGLADLVWPAVDNMDCVLLLKEAQLLELSLKERCDHEPNELLLSIKIRAVVVRVSPQQADELATSPLQQLRKAIEEGSDLWWL